MNSLKYLILCATLLGGVVTTAQQLPQADIYFDFNNNFLGDGYSSDWTYNTMALLPNTVTKRPGRNNLENQAIVLDAENRNDKIEVGPQATHPFKHWGLPTDSEAFTVAGWFYIDPSVNGKQVVFYGHDGSEMKVGIIVEGKRVYLRRFINVEGDPNGTNGTVYDFRQWNPVLLNGQGWYFLALTQTKWITRVYVGGIEPENQLGVKYHFLGAQPVTGITEWGIGNPYPSSDVYKSVGAVDDFLVWNKNMVLEDMYRIYQCSKFNEYNSEDFINCKENENNTARIATEGDSEELEELEEKFVTILYPNPNKGEFQVQHHLKKPSPVRILVMSMDGVIVYKEELIREQGTHTETIRLPFDLPDGMYRVGLMTNEMSSNIWSVKKSE